MVHVRFFGMVRLTIKIKDMDIESDNLDDMLKKIADKTSKITYKELKNTLIFVNGKSIAELKLLKTGLKDGDTVEVFSPAAGG